MAYAIDAATLAALNAGQANTRYMVLFDFVSGFYGFWGGHGTLSHNGVTYVGAGSLFSVEDIGQVTDGSAVPIVLVLNGMANSALSPDALASIEAETYHQRPVVIMTAYFEEDGRTLRSVETEYRGYIDRISHQHRIGGEAVLRFHLESKARDHFKAGYRMRTDADQGAIDANDGGLRHAIQAASVTVQWGRSDKPATFRERMQARRAERKANRGRGRLFG